MLYNRKKYKEFAKIQLKNRWGIPVLITAVTALICALFKIPDYIKVFRDPVFVSFATNEYSDISSMYQACNEALKSVSSHKSTILMVVQLLVQGILNVAAINVYLKMSRSPQKVSFGLFIESLNDWGRAVLATLWKGLWIYLWSMLFIIPGIIKAIAYSQLFYIINEYKNISIPKAMQISILITKGHKSELFVMYLSFIGWAILASLTMGIGFLWLKPYMNMTLINSYHALMKDALETGILRPEDLA